MGIAVASRVPLIYENGLYRILVYIGGMQRGDSHNQAFSFTLRQSETTSTRRAAEFYCLLGGAL